MCQPSCKLACETVDELALVGRELDEAAVGQERLERILAARCAGERLEQGQPAERRVHRAVAALLLEHHSAAGVLVGDRDQPLCDRRKRAGRQRERRQRVVHAGVDARDDQHEVGLEGLECRDHDAVDRVQVAAVAGARGQRHVDVRALGAGAAASLRAAGVGREHPVLVHGDREHRGVVVEDRLGPVAVVGVDVDDRDPLHARSLGGGRRDGDVVEDAEPVAGVARGVMAGAATDRIAAVGVAGEHALHAGEHRAGAEQREIVGLAVHRREPSAGVAPAVLGHRAHPLDVLGRMDRLELLHAWPCAARTMSRRSSSPTFAIRRRSRRIRLGLSTWRSGSTSPTGGT